MAYEDYLREAVPDMAARHKVSADTVRHLIRFYGSRAERVLDLADREPSLGRPLSSESMDIQAQVVYSVLEEGAKTLSDIILRRMHLGVTGSRGVGQAGEIAEAAGRELRWSAEEKKHSLEHFYDDIRKERTCLKAVGGDKVTTPA